MSDRGVHVGDRMEKAENMADAIERVFGVRPEHGIDGDNNVILRFGEADIHKVARMHNGELLAVVWNQ